MLSVLIPAMNEEESLESTIFSISSALESNSIPYEIIVINDNSTDKTADICNRLSIENKWLKSYHRLCEPGIGNALKLGLDNWSGDYLAIMMADASDDPFDLVNGYQSIVGTSTDCFFGSRWIKDSVVTDYPVPKLILNRLANFLICILFLYRYNDTTNAFKIYNRAAINLALPLHSSKFNFLVELPLKVIVRGSTYITGPISWKNRRAGVAKLKLREMSKHYLMVIFCILLEKFRLIKGKELPSFFKKRWV